MTAALAAFLPAPAFHTPRRAPKVRSAEELRTALRISSVAHSAPDLTQLDRVLRLDAGDGRVEVQAGVTWAALSAYLSAQSIADAGSLASGAACVGLPATVGECIARNPACPDGSPFADHVSALAVVTADGELRRASRGQQADLFHRVLGSHGMFAAVYSATLCIESLARAFAVATPPVTLDAACEGATPGEPIQFMVPPANLEHFLADLRQAFDDYRLPVCGLSVRRSLPDRSTHLRWATAELALVEVRLPLRTTLPAHLAATQVRRALFAAAVARGGRFDLATAQDASREQVEAAYPMLRTLLAEQRRCDPQARLGGAFLRHYRSLFQRESCDVRWTCE